MAQWGLMSKLLPYMSTESIDNLYQPATFPIYVRYLLADWIEKQQWYCQQTHVHAHCQTHIHTFSNTLICVCVCVPREDFELEKADQRLQAQALLDKIIIYLRTQAECETNVVEKMRLMHTSSNMVRPTTSSFLSEWVQSCLLSLFGFSAINCQG